MRRLGRSVALAVATLLLVLAPVSGAVVAVRLAPPAQVVVAGQTVHVKPVIGRSRTELLGGALVRPEHAHVGVGNVGIDVGLDLGLDWNRLIPQDKATRAYLGQLFDDPAPAIDLIRGAVRAYLVRWIAVGFGGVLLLEVVAVWVVRRRRRRLAALPPAVGAAVAEHNAGLRTAVTAVAALTLVALHLAAVQTLAHRDQQAVVGSPFLAGTGLEGTEVRGLAGEVVPFLSVLQPHSAFYDRVSENLDAALADSGQGTGDTGASAGAESAGSGDSADEGDDDVVFVTAEDLEDVNGMARIIGRAAKVTGADFIGYSGDLTFAGKPVESYLLDTIDYYSGDVPVEFAPGLHDTDAIVQAASTRGWRVADDRTHDVAGISVLSLADPRISTVGDFGVGTVQRAKGVDVQSFLDDAIDEACATHPDIVLLHDHLLGARIATAGCQRTAVIDGRSFRRIGAQVRMTADGDPTLEYTMGSAGGHVDTTPNPGVITHPATFEVFRLDPDTHALRVSVVTVRPNGSVRVTAPQPIP